ADSGGHGPPYTRLEVHAGLMQEIASLCETLGAVPATGAQHGEALRLLLKAAEWEINYYRQQAKPLEESGDKVPATGDKNGRIDRDTLLAFVRSRHVEGNEVSIAAFEAIPGGYGKQTSRFTLAEPEGRERELIVRKSDRNPMVLHGTFLIDKEYALVKAVSATGYPAPKPLWLGSGVVGVDADFYVMERLPGRIPGSFLGGAEGKIGESLLLDVAAQLARLHAIPLAIFADYIREHDEAEMLSERAIGSVESCYRRAILAWSEYAKRVEHLPSPHGVYLRDWLLRNVPKDTRRPVLVHGDFNIHNLLVEGERVTGVLDWECAMFGAPEQDLAYIQPHIGRLIDFDMFLARYEQVSVQAGGRPIDRSVLPFYQAFSMMRLHIGMNHGLLNLQTGANRDIRYAMIELAFGPQIMEMGLASTKL
ncbi:MAG: phosphotransferase family protein, partial [Panacagrimonas sp.]